MPHNLYIPSLGSLLILAEPWNFKLFFENRNNSLLKALCPNPVPVLPDGVSKDSYQGKYHAKFFGTHPSHHEGSPLLEQLPALTEAELKYAHSTFRTTNRKDQPYLNVTLPVGQQLQVSRIFIRAGITAYDSVTFRTTKIGLDKKLRSKRFWVKLQDANKIVCNIIG